MCDFSRRWRRSSRTVSVTPVTIVTRSYLGYVPEVRDCYRRVTVRTEVRNPRVMNLVGSVSAITCSAGGGSPAGTVRHPR